MLILLYLFPGEYDQATQEEVERPRCGLPDKKSGDSSRKLRFATTGFKWPSDKSTLTYRFNNTTPDLPESEARSIVVLAFKVCHINTY